MSEVPGAAALARQAAESLRSLNHATLSRDGLACPGDAYAVLGELAGAVSRLPQALAQVGRHLAAALEAGQLGSDDGTDPAVAVSGTELFLDHARGTAAALAEDLSLAWQQLSPVNGRPFRKDQP